MRSKNAVCMLAASLLPACAAPTLGAAEVRFSGNIDQFVLEAKNATLSEIVSGMQSALNCKIILRGSINQQFTGTYSGSLRRVLAHLLKGANYVVSPDRDQISIVLIAADGARGTRIAQPGSVDEPARDVQGWNGRPSELPAPGRPAAGTSVTAAGDPVPSNSSDVQGWTGRPSELPAPARQAGGASVTAALDSELSKSSDVQGWTGHPSELPAPARPAAGASVTVAVDPEPSNSSDVQGWTGEPSERPPRVIPH